MLVSFSMFCSLSIALTGSVYFFLFRSTVSMEVNMQVGRGSVGIATVDDQGLIRSGPILTRLSDRPAVISTGTLDQATITFDLPDSITASDAVLGTLTLKNSSSVTLQTARHPRFSWSQGAYTIDFNNFVGEAEIFITEIGERPLQLRVSTRQGGAVFVFDTEGRYEISANDNTIRVITYAGRALLVSPDGRNNRFAIAGEQATLLTGSNLPVVTSAPVDLVNNGLFAFDIIPNAEGQLQIPPQWGCFNAFEQPPSGSWFSDHWQGRSSIRLLREVGDATSRTGCSRWLDVPVDNYSFLELQATFTLNYQSLINCGFTGSECPLMIFIDYLDTNGNRHSWYQSFFYNYDPQNPAPLVCQECARPYEHRPIAEQVWYTYESGNLFSRLPDEERPARILELRFYASGHRYDVFVSEMSLFAGTQRAIVPTDNVPQD
ncbi:MAG: hypothetical protein ACFE0Q_17420 [Anaerolineae bacterium]